jgi:hypothetical protein
MKLSHFRIFFTVAEGLRCWPRLRSVCVYHFQFDQANRRSPERAGPETDRKLRNDSRDSLTVREGTPAFQRPLRHVLRRLDVIAKRLDYRYHLRIS